MAGTGLGGVFFVFFLPPTFDEMEWGMFQFLVLCWHQPASGPSVLCHEIDDSLLDLSDLTVAASTCKT